MNRRGEVYGLDSAHHSRAFGDLIMDVTGKIAIVTGGGRGIGRSIALVLARNGADIAVADLNLDDAQKVAAEVAQLGRKSLSVSR